MRRAGSLIPSRLRPAQAVVAEGPVKDVIRDDAKNIPRRGEERRGETDSVPTATVRCLGSYE